MKHFPLRLVFVFMMIFCNIFYNFGFLELWDERGKEKEWVVKVKKINNYINWAIGENGEIIEPHPFFKYLWIFTDNVMLEYISKKRKKDSKFFYFGLSSGFCLFNIILPRKKTLGLLNFNFNFIQVLTFLIRSLIVSISSSQEPQKRKADLDFFKEHQQEVYRIVQKYIIYSSLLSCFINSIRFTALSLTFGDYIKIRVISVPYVVTCLYWAIFMHKMLYDSTMNILPWCNVHFKRYITLTENDKIIAFYTQNNMYWLISPSIEINIKKFIEK